MERVHVYRGRELREKEDTEDKCYEENRGIKKLWERKRRREKKCLLSLMGIDKWERSERERPIESKVKKLRKERIKTTRQTFFSISLSSQVRM